MSVPEAVQATSDHTDRIPLSVQQEFLCLWDKGDAMGPFGPRFHVVDGWRVAGEVDLDALRAALDDVVVRHEALRTVVVRDQEPRFQKIMPPSSPSLEVRDLPSDDPDARDLRVEEFLNELAAEDLNIRELPLLRAILGRFDEQDSVLGLIAHHTAVDAWSMQQLRRDLAACYAARKAGQLPELPPATQYQEYASWQQEHSQSASVRAARVYWGQKLDEAGALALPTDRLRSAEPVFSTGWYRFLLGRELRSATSELATAMRCSPFMILLAAFNVYVNRMTGATDVVALTFTPGREQARFHETIGSFFNCLPIRTDISDCGTFRDVVAKTRANCIEAYTHEIPLAQILQEAPELMAPVVVDGVAACVFQVIQTPHMNEREQIGDLEYSAVRRKVLSQTIGSDIPDGTLLCLELDSTGDLIGELGYSRNLYDESTAHKIVSTYQGVLLDAVTTPDAPL